MSECFRQLVLWNHSQNRPESLCDQLDFRQLHALFLGLEVKLEPRKLAYLSPEVSERHHNDGFNPVLIRIVPVMHT